jgi:hypothetical protein
VHDLPGSARLVYRRSPDMWGAASPTLGAVSIPPRRRRFVLRIHRVIFVGVVTAVVGVGFVVRGRQRAGRSGMPDAPAAADTPTAPSPAVARTEPPPSARTPASVEAEDREVRAIDALVAKGDIGRARAVAEEFLERHPTGPRAAHVERLTGVHPHLRQDD